MEKQPQHQIEHLRIVAHELVQIDAFVAGQPVEEDLEGAGHDLGGAAACVFPPEVAIDILVAPPGGPVSSAPARRAKRPPTPPTGCAASGICAAISTPFAKNTGA